MMIRLELSEEDLIKLGIESITSISEPEFKPLFMIKFIDSEKEYITFNDVEKLKEYVTEILPAEIRINKIDDLLE